VIPKLKGINPQLLQNFNKTIEHLQDSKDIIDDRIDSISDAIITKVNENEIHFDISKIEDLNNPKAYLYELLKNYGFTEWNDVYDLLDAQSSKQVFSSTHRLIKDRDCLILSKISIKENLNIFTVFENDISIEIPLGTLHFETTKQLNKLNESTIFVDKDKLNFPLTVRKWQEGDYFYPFGMEGKKKLSKFFKDEKLSLIDKENVRLLCSEEDIIWIINRRLDSRFKVIESTEQIIKIELK